MKNSREYRSLAKSIAKLKFTDCRITINEYGRVLKIKDTCFNEINSKITIEIKNLNERRKLRGILKAKFGKSLSQQNIITLHPNLLVFAEPSISRFGEESTKTKPNSGNYPYLYKLLPAQEAFEIEKNLDDLFYLAFLPVCEGNEKRARSLHRRQTAYAVISYWKYELKISIITLVAFTKLPRVFSVLKDYFVS